MTWHTRMLLILLALILFAPSAVIAWQNSTLLAIQHQRPLAARPGLTAMMTHPIAFFDDLDQWHKDHVGFGIRDGRLYRRAVYVVLGDSGAVNIERGPGGMVFLASHGADRSQSSIANSCPSKDKWREISETVTKDWEVILSEFRIRALDPILLIYPSKKTLYPDLLPTTVSSDLRWRCQNMRAQGDPIINLAEAFPENVVDAYIHLAAHKDRPHFYPPENFHADGESAFRAAHAVMRRWNWRIEEIEDVSFHTHRGASDLSIQLGFRLSASTNEPIGTNKISIIPRSDILELLRQELAAPVYAMDYINPDAAIDEDVLIIANSFGIRTAPNFSRYVKSVRIIETNQIRDVTQIRSLFDRFVFADPPDRVLFVLHEESVFKNRLDQYVNGLMTAQVSMDD